MSKIQNGTKQVPTYATRCDGPFSEHEWDEDMEYGAEPLELVHSYGSPYDGQPPHHFCSVKCLQAWCADHFAHRASRGPKASDTSHGGAADVERKAAALLVSERGERTVVQDAGGKP